MADAIVPNGPPLPRHKSAITPAMVRQWSAEVKAGQAQDRKSVQHRALIQRREIIAISQVSVVQSFSAETNYSPQCKEVTIQKSASQVHSTDL